MLKVLNNIFLIFISLFILVYFFFFDKSSFGINFFIEIMNFNWFKLKYIFMIDGISLFFIILSSFLLGLCILIGWIWAYKINIYVFCIFLSMFCLINIFGTIDFFVLFFFLN